MRLRPGRAALPGSLLAAALAFGSCTNGEAAPASPALRPVALVTFHTSTADVAVQVEVRDTPDGRARGLMYRRSLDETQGMVFVFPNVAEHSFWMKNTYLPLDMIFVDAQFNVVGVVQNAEPMTLTSRTVGVPSKYVVETIAGFAKKHGISRGTRSSMEGVPTTAKR